MISLKSNLITCDNNYYALHQLGHNTDNSLIILCIHGIGESGLCFKEAISNIELLRLGTIVIPDLPGFGASCYAEIAAQSDYLATATYFLLNILNSAIAKNNDVVLVSHSAGNVIALNLISHISDRLIAYVDLDGVYKIESWRYSSYVDQYDSARAFYDQAYKNLLEEIQHTPTEYFLRYYSSFIRCNYAAFYSYAKATQKFLNSQQNYISIAREKHLFIGSKKISGEIMGCLDRRGIKTVNMRNLNHWAMIEEPTVVYGALAKWISNCTTLKEQGNT